MYKFKLPLSTFLLFFSVLFLMDFSASAQKKERDAEKKVPVTSGTFSSLSFRGIGPAFTSGRVNDFAVNPENFSEYYVGVAAGGVWKTSNNGATWKPVFDNYGSWSIGAVVIDPANTSTVCVGTG